MSDYVQSRTPNQFTRRMPRRRSSGGLQDENRLPLRKQLVRQLLCLFIAFVIIVLASAPLSGSSLPSSRLALTTV